MQVVLGILVIWGIILCIKGLVSWIKNKITGGPKKPGESWRDYGDAISILGRTFVRNGSGYEYAGLWYGEQILKDNEVKTYCMVLPNIWINHEKFLSMLEQR